MSRKTLLKLQDKNSFIHIFSALMQDPFKLSQSKEFPLSTEDFPERFYKIIYSAIYNLYHEGLEKITPIEIDGYLSNTPTQYQIFNDNKGGEYLELVEETGQPENFEYHYIRVKKFTLLRQYYEAGIDFSDIYDLDLFIDAEQEIEQNKRFNEMTIQQMVKHIESKLIDIKDKFIFDKDGYGGHVSENLKDILSEKQKAPSYGASFPSGYYNTSTRGARKRKFYCVSGNTGSGKTRKLLGDLLSFCVPIIYDSQKKKWVKTGAIGSGLFISSELEEDEIKIPAICYVADIDEEKINDNTLTEEEQKRLDIALQILDKTNFWVEELFDFDIDDIQHLVEKYVNKHDVGYFAFDYIHSTLKMFDYMARKGAKNLQEHQLLRIMSIQLKNMCNKYDIWIGTATQLNSKWKEEGNMDETAIEGSKSVANKFDLGCIQIPLTIKDEQLYDEIKAQANFNFGKHPTHTINIYKNRGNKWKMIRIWVHFDMGTLRVYDLFVTDYRGRIIEMKPKKIKFMDTTLDVDMSDEDVLKEIEKITKHDTTISTSVARKDNKDSDNHEMDETLKNELKEVYTEIFEDELPESILEELDKPSKKFGEDKKDNLFNW